MGNMLTLSQEELDQLIATAVDKAVTKDRGERLRVNVAPVSSSNDGGTASYPPLTRANAFGVEAARYAWAGYRYDGSTARVPKAAQGGNPVGALETAQEYLKGLRLEYNGALREVDSAQIGAPYTGVPDMDLALILVMTKEIFTPDERAASLASGGGLAGTVQASDANFQKLMGGWTAAQYLDEKLKIKENSSGTPDAGASGNEVPQAPAPPAEFIGGGPIKGRRG